VSTKKRNAAGAQTHKWEFKARFRRTAFGWKSQPAITRVKQAVAEVKKVARKEPLLAAEGAVVFLGRVSPALEHVDSSSGAIGTAVNNAIGELVPIIAYAPADAETRDTWLERLFDAYRDDGIPYTEWLGDHWGTLCASKDVASTWADRLMDGAKLAWSPDPRLRGFFKGTTNCLSALVAAERYDDVLALLELAPHQMWHYRQYGGKALAARGKKSEAIRYAEEGRGLNDSPVAIARACDELLLSSRLVDEAYRRYGLVANQGGTCLATFRAVAKKYPHKAAKEILADLVETTPGDEGKWFAAAKDAGLCEEALELASQTPCDPKTLTRAARDFAAKEPAFALGAGFLALEWLLKGYGYDVTGADVWAAYSSTLAAAERLGSSVEAKKRIREMVAAESASGLVSQVLGRELGL
jgi:tetratricopeptide (TPR) repeat protein